jgi:Mg2+ and Co2+ transporter CorA
MIVNIRNYIDDKLDNHIDERIENTNHKALRTIYDFKHEYKLGINGLLTIFSQNINLKKQFGGTAFSIKLKDNRKYTYHLGQITSEKNNTQHRLCFLNLNEEDESLCFTYHTKETGIHTLTIKDLIINNENKYIECNEPKYKFKSGDILVQILIELVKTNEAFSHIKRIELQDNSMKRCYGIGIQLKYLRTITDGIPYYAKFGFIPKEIDDQKIYIKNKNKYINNCGLNNQDLKNIFLKVKNNKSLYEHYIKYYREFVINNEEIDICLFIKNMVNMENNKNISSTSKKLACELVAKIIKPLFKILGYIDYESDLWILNIK